MIKNILSILLLLCFSNLPIQFVDAKQTLQFKATSDWVLRYEDDSCRLFRRFGEGKDTIMIVFTRFGPGDDFRFTLAGKAVHRYSGKRPLFMQFGPHEEIQEVEYAKGTMGKLPALIVVGSMRIAPWTETEKKKITANEMVGWYRVAPLSDERYKAVDRLFVQFSKKKSISLQLASLAKPFAAFDTCIDELMTHWGIDVERHKGMTAPARPATNPGNWIKSREYPKDMLGQGQPALVNFRLSIDENGNTTDCHIQQTTRPREFDKAVCKTMMRRSMFHPALDKDGKPMASYYRNTVRFKIGY